MESFKLRTGRKIPKMGLGTWKLTEETALTVEYALNIGYRLIDTSSDYGSQPGIGVALKNAKIPREEVFITTKIEEYDNPLKRTESNLKELKLDYVDLMLIHRPPQKGAGENLWEGLLRARQKGLVKDIGVSNYSIDLMENLIESSGEVPAVNQIEWSPFGHSLEMLKFCLKNRILIQAYSPLTRDKNLDDLTLAGIAKKYNKTPAQILIRWNIQLGICPIPKASQKDHLKENIDVFKFEIDQKDMDILSSMNMHQSLLGALPY